MLTALRKTWRHWVRPLLLPLLLVLAAKSSLAEYNPVPSGSMKPTILEGDVVFINKLAYDLKLPFTTLHLAHWADPAAGDVVVCYEPDDGTRLIKRVVGVPGDTLELRHDILYINGQPRSYGPLGEHPGVDALAPAERASAIFARETLGAGSHAVMALPRVPARRDFGPIQVPAGSYFVMGDNRDNSKDSRYFGFVPRDQILGQAKGIFVSGDMAHWLKPRFNRFFTKLD